MAKTVFLCDSCGYESVRWTGKCPSCDEWNTFSEHLKEKKTKAKTSMEKTIVNNISTHARTFSLEEIDNTEEIRYQTGMGELDRVLGGGIVKGSLILLSGDPGIGKSTILLQICQSLGENQKVLYISGEESPRQIKLRAERLSVKSENLSLLTSTDMETAVNIIISESPNFVIVDSIQTMTVDGISSSPGSIVQVRESTNAFIKIAKSLNIPICIVGHVNKDGAIAGPKILEHMVDTVLYFEGERHQNYRILRAVKNRYGSTNEIGVFEMTNIGLKEIPNPSMMFLSERPIGVSGTCVSCIMEGTRPLLAEVQALVTKSGFGTPRRMATGFDYNRATIIIAILEKRAGFIFSNLDTYINVVGGIKLLEPAADLSVAMALISSLRDKPINEHIIAFGEIGLAGEVRSVTHTLQRIKEAERLGFLKCIIPKNSLKEIDKKEVGKMEIIGVSNILDAIKFI